VPDIDFEIILAPSKGKVSCNQIPACSTGLLRKDNFQNQTPGISGCTFYVGMLMMTLAGLSLISTSEK
jgi:hypothetical protein